MDNPQFENLSSLLQEYGFNSETAEVLVNNDGLAILNWLKVQSGSIRNG
jgi:hypothetical protein